MSTTLGERGLRSIVDVFTHHARTFPEAVAVSGEDGDLSYAQLDRRTTALAGALRASGAAAGDVVGILLPRSVDLVVLQLAVLKAGCAYLVLAPDTPVERRAAILRDARPALVVGGEAPWTTPAELAARAGDVPLGTPRGADTAYVAYTSGSTGTPKGVVVPHRAVVRLVVGADYLPVGRDDVFLQFAPAAFDASTLEIWGPLLNGGKLVVAPAGDLRPADLTALVRDRGVTVLWLTAGLFHQVVEAGLADLTGLRLLIAGGDVLSPSHVDRAIAALPSTAVVNGYGPTENTTFTCCAVLDGPVGAGAVPIGRPVTGTLVHLLDEHGDRVPDGRTGRIFTSGLGLAHGYLGAPGATADRFVPDPFSGVPGDRMYATGDLGRRGPDGRLEFLGREDRQVKIRGFRVEPAEVEVVLRTHPDVEDVAVLPRPSATGQALTAYYASDEAVISAWLRDHLAAFLPPYMIPARFVRVDELPLTANGKVDRSALAALALPDRGDLSTDYRAPATPLESWLAELWADLLQVERVGVDDDFFEIGGHSLMAVRLTSEIFDRHEVDVPIHTYYENPTVAELAALIARGCQGAEEAS
ncbi:non-ribosomal peptide synthetase [Umezawaea sp. Da 62-37]|uniref:non-ribosomal peptide synthetase n=1 Tax=Umezawaea sp. Da 62-37 TaxID=3075927 RepID=UPI0028F6D390|nr:non-ribosomal peptide synthetase [Umezawaea sp. Da 62-37]WNV84701.1 non-ribosomal peptide synthetase [Umezawaea sp. Da 62-37]